MNWKFWQRKQEPAPVEVRILNRELCKLRLHEWRSDAKLTNVAMKVLMDPNVQTMLQVCANEHPAFSVLNTDSPPHLRASHQSQCEGYTLFLSNLEAMANHQPLQGVLEAEFLPEEQINQ